MEVAKVGGNVTIQKVSQENAKAVAETLLEPVKAAVPPPGTGSKINVKA